jgi:hypothetical protein
LEASNITSIDGNISITGQGGNGSGSDNYGIYSYNGAITSTGTGVNAANITLNGTGGGTGANNHGILIDGNSIAGINEIESAYGDISLTGIGSSELTGGFQNGISINGYGNIVSSGIGDNAATITLHGTGGAGTGGGRGVQFTSPGATIETMDGNILITGTAVLLEVTPEGEIVWRLKVNNPGFRTPKDAPALGFYKAQRIRKGNPLAGR